MCEIEIKFKSTLSDSKIFDRYQYIATTTNGEFEAVVTVSKYNNEDAYVGQIQCVKGEAKLNRYEFWSKIQSETLKLHNNGKASC